MRKALEQAKAGRNHILDEMAKCSPAPRGSISPNAPYMLVTQIDPAKNGAIIGSGGRTIKVRAVVECCIFVWRCVYGVDTSCTLMCSQALV